MIDPLIYALLLDSEQIEPGELFYPIEIQDVTENTYLISPLGKVYTSKRKRLLKQWDNRGYRYVSLGKRPGGRIISHSVHGLVAKHFIPNPFNHPHVHHKDNNPINNAWNNLEWLSVRDHIEATKRARELRGSHFNPLRNKNSKTDK